MLVVGGQNGVSALRAKCGHEGLHCALICGWPGQRSLARGGSPACDAWRHRWRALEGGRGRHAIRTVASQCLTPRVPLADSRCSSYATVVPHAPMARQGHQVVLQAAVSGTMITSLVAPVVL